MCFFSRKMATRISRFSIPLYHLSVDVGSSFSLHVRHPLSSTAWRRRFSFSLSLSLLLVPNPYCLSNPNRYSYLERPYAKKIPNIFFSVAISRISLSLHIYCRYLDLVFSLQSLFSYSYRLVFLLQTEQCVLFKLDPALLDQIGQLN